MSFLKRTFAWLPWLIIFINLQVISTGMYFANFKQNVADLLSTTSFCYGGLFIIIKNSISGASKTKLVYPLALSAMTGGVTTLCITTLFHIENASILGGILGLHILLMLSIALLLTPWFKKYKAVICKLAPESFHAKFLITSIFFIWVVICCTLTRFFYNDNYLIEVKKYLWIITLMATCLAFWGKDQLKWLYKI